MLGDFGINELAAQRLEAFERAFLVRPHQPRIPRHIGSEDRGETAGLGHPSQPALRRPSSIWAWSSGRNQGGRVWIYMSNMAGANAIAFCNAPCASPVGPS